MTFETLFLFSGLSFHALTDLRTRALPAASLFCLAGVIIGLSHDAFKVITVLLTVIWGIGIGEKALALLFLFHPTTLFLLAPAYASRTSNMALGDLLILAGIAAAFPSFAVLFALLGIELWRNWWKWRRLGAGTPLVPGILIGISVYLFAIN